MIGVLSKHSERSAVEEFFELFKTPWEFFVPDRIYEMVISTVEDMPECVNARAVLIYQSSAIRADEALGVLLEPATKGGWVEWEGTAFPVYGGLAKLRAVGNAVLRQRQTGEAVGCFIDSAVPAARLGFDLFSEVAFLLSEGQPPENAQIPALDLHISLLRCIMARIGISFVEVPPVPAGYDFLASLTHDVDFVGIRDHKWDRTMWGFLYRSLIESLIAALRGKLPWSRCLQNWAAACSLPLVHLGMRSDFWLEFDRYREIEKGLGSTFFFIPFKDVPGTSAGATAPQARAAKYDLTAIKERVLGLVKDGCEIGLHGIDAWHSTANGREELRRIQELSGQTEIGTRIHWLYWSQASPGALDKAGFSYDSTLGYNDAIGFRAGTTQPFRPLATQYILELPLNIQDTAMFYSNRMSLSEDTALVSCKSLIRCLASFGGALTTNWHTRSLSPERLWGDFYLQLIREVQRYRVWFATARQVVGWFRHRRALRFDVQHNTDGNTTVTLISPAGYSEPPFTVRICQCTPASHNTAPPFLTPSQDEFEWNGEATLDIILVAGQGKPAQTTS